MGRCCLIERRYIKSVAKKDSKYYSSLKNQNVGDKYPPSKFMVKLADNYFRKYQRANFRSDIPVTYTFIENEYSRVKEQVYILESEYAKEKKELEDLQSDIKKTEDKYKNAAKNYQDFHRIGKGNPDMVANTIPEIMQIMLDLEKTLDKKRKKEKKLESEVKEYENKLKNAKNAIYKKLKEYINRFHMDLSVLRVRHERIEAHYKERYDLYWSELIYRCRNVSMERKPLRELCAERDNHIKRVDDLYKSEIDKVDKVDGEIAQFLSSEQTSGEYDSNSEQDSEDKEG